MADVINLNQARKSRDKAQRSKKASENRALHGQTKAQKTSASKAADKLKQGLDGARRDRGPPKV